MSTTGRGDWDAATYDRISDPQARWGSEVLGRLALAGDEVVLDAGCGTGRVTEQVLARLPRGRVIGLDVSPAMLIEAARRLAPYGPRVRLVCADLLQPLPLARPVDAVFSTATFHWITDHVTLFRNLAAVLRPGGQLVAQCGGAGNIARVLEALRRLGHDWTGPWLFATPEETAQRLKATGFVDIQTWLQPAPITLPPGEPFETYLATVILRLHLERLRPEERVGFVKTVAAALPECTIDYVRLNIVARRA
jgi:trans-aconitate 2-methyltransferase